MPCTRTLRDGGKLLCATRYHAASTSQWLNGFDRKVEPTVGSQLHCALAPVAESDDEHGGSLRATHATARVQRAGR